MPLYCVVGKVNVTEPAVESISQGTEQVLAVTTEIPKSELYWLGNWITSRPPAGIIVSKINLKR